MAGLKSITIDQFSVAVHDDYARLIEQARQVEKEFPVGQLANLSGQVRVDTVTPQPTELDLLGLQAVPVVKPWAAFLAPERASGKRGTYRMPFGVALLLPSLGSSEDCATLQQKVLEFPCKTPEEERERTILDNYFGILQKLNIMSGDIFNRIHQFIHG